MEQAAVDELTRKAARDLNLTPLDGQWVAQLSSKYIGITDERQETASRSHTFRAVDILAEHKALESAFGSQYSVRLIRGQDFGERKTFHGKTFWYTFVLDDFSSRAEVQSFCEENFPHDVKNNRCLPTRKLKP